MRETPAESRTAKIERLRQEIAAGTYDTPDRLAAALDVFAERHLCPAPPVAPAPHSWQPRWPS